MKHRAATLPEGAATWLAGLSPADASADSLPRDRESRWFQPSGGTIAGAGGARRFGRSGEAGKIERVRRLAGSTSSELYAFEAVAFDGARRLFVLRWYPDGSVLDAELDLIERESAALGALAATSVRAPRLIAAGSRALLMTHIHGGVRLALPDPGALREALADIHALDPSAMAKWRYAGYHEDVVRGHEGVASGRAVPEPARPTWWRDARAWERALHQTETDRPTAPDVVIHRDLHPGNVLWNGRRISGIVDWVNACTGPAAIDFAHCRVNLAVLWGLEAADAFSVIDPAWDIEAALGFLDWDPVGRDAWPGALPRSFVEGGGPDLAAEVIRERLETFVREALARLA